jgi:cytochrome o ubiquinol oxidase operon protein cyoD
MIGTPREDRDGGANRPRETAGGERRSYVTGLFVALVLTLIPFAMLAWDMAERRTVLVTLAVTALLQVAAHFRWFLHIRFRGQSRDDLQLILFTGLILILMAGGTVFILANLATRMH